ncbi:ABC-F family ATP-binding cassette domain-containing protein [Rhodoplanes sp. TEM]|uniref:ABC-F family ATP-binding cassette domain-containing protein n=1 Tax=Rhodoplanes tepidamans TaxID=200616 RepID=A0ABT5JKQ4_RHOTP|nr:MULTISPECIES: ABC-F family ATP-binding cassette domain-containing protein [Rhodoplanes]MDC7789545.1 ABC-F family ATP-binding cassette domain-containing protein [Rhodoplanes tepidamans]MDC7986720.1 ABC-F family ATP-binding cassette domain-containing protein [Rhodoplanes sp. TEM]MDQ0359166.1 ATP-binding cassette subfamily F protein 3 [Rhodoplanes tepidamans]
MLAITDLTVRIAGRLLIDRATVQIPAGARVGLVGRNGTGKSTLFRTVTGEHHADTGEIVVPARTVIGTLPQEAPNGPDPLIDIVLAAHTERTALLAEAETATDPHRIAELHTRLADIGAHSAPARAAAILHGLGFSHEDQKRPVSEFSGGWRMRVALAAVLFREPDVLLLDEPTNYLDLEGTLWLEEHLARYPHTVVVISHDRDLLDNAVDSILHLENGKLTFYRGNYSTFERTRRERLLLDQKLAKKQEAQRARLTAFVERFRAKATKARQAQSRLKMLARLGPAPARIADEVREIVLPAPARLLSPPIIAVDDVSVGYEPGKPVLRRVTLRIDNDDRVALLGANGNGKSTLVKLIAGRIGPMDGRVTRADKLDVGYFAQHQLDELDEGASVYAHVRRLMPDAAESAVRAKAGAIGFSEGAADTLVGKLSGGEKARLLLGLATFHAPHLLLLDEPTNHLDIDSRSALIEAINEFPGAVVMVSHDRYLLDACADRLWLVGNGGVAPFDGDLDDYRKLVLAGDDEPDDKASRTDKSPSRTDQRRAAAEKRAGLAPLKKKINALEKQIETLHQRIARLDAALADPALYARDPGKAAGLAKDRADAAAGLATAEDEWLTLSAEYEEAMAE